MFDFTIKALSPDVCAVIVTGNPAGYIIRDSNGDYVAFDENGKSLCDRPYISWFRAITRTVSHYTGD